MTLHLRFWGTRGSVPTPGARTVRYGGNTPCVEVRTGTGWLVILDAGMVPTESADAAVPVELAAQVVGVGIERLLEQQRPRPRAPEGAREDAGTERRTSRTSVGALARQGLSRLRGLRQNS